MNQPSKKAPSARPAGPIRGRDLVSLADADAGMEASSSADSLAGATPLSRPDDSLAVGADVLGGGPAGAGAPREAAPGVAASDIIVQPSHPPAQPGPLVPATATVPARQSVAAPAGGRARVCHVLARGAAVAAAALGVILLVDGLLHAGAPRGAVESAAAVRAGRNPLTAACFLLCGGALWLLGPGRPPRWAGMVARALAGIAAVIGAVRLIGLAPGLDVGLDRWLAPGAVGAERMARIAALNFLLTGAALVLMDGRAAKGSGAGAGRRAMPALALTAGAVALLALAGYAYGVSDVGGVGGSVAMAPHVALGALLLSAGALCARPDRGPLATILSETTGGTIARRLLPAAAALPLLAGWVVLRGVRADQYDAPFGMLLFALTTAAVFVGLTWWSAKSLVRADADQREAEGALRSAEAVYHSLVETLPQRIFRKDLAGRFTFGNGNFCRARGRTLAELVGKSDLDFSPPVLAERYRRDDRRVAETGQTLDIVEEYVKTDGSRRYVHTIKTPIYGADGRITGVQGIHWDVTDRKLAEQALERTNRQLAETAAAERRAREALQQAHEELKRAQTHLVQSEKMAGLGQMVAGVAHEINNPLAFVSNNVAVLARDVGAVVAIMNVYQKADAVIARHSPDVSAELRELADRADLPYTLENLGDLLSRSREGLKRIQQIVKDLRYFARLDEDDLHDADLNAGIESTLNIVTGAAKKKDVRIEAQLGPLPPVACYPAKVNQVVMNLITNAIDASPAGGRVTVRTSAVDGGAGSAGSPRGPAVRIEVADEGPGVAPAIRARIFDPFFTTKPLGQGTGLGLSISYGIVQDHGGTIDVHSVPGQGATFVVTLPVSHVEG